MPDRPGAKEEITIRPAILLLAARTFLIGAALLTGIMCANHVFPPRAVFGPLDQMYRQLFPAGDQY